MTLAATDALKNESFDFDCCMAVLPPLRAHSRRCGAVAAAARTDAPSPLVMVAASRRDRAQRPLARAGRRT